MRQWIKKGGEVIADRIWVMRTPLQQFMGLRFRKRLLPGEAMVFPLDRPMRLSVDMWFVFFPIDVVFLDEAHRIVAVREMFRPFRMLLQRIPCSCMVELPAKTVRRKRLRIGDRLSFSPGIA